MRSSILRVLCFFRGHVRPGRRSNLYVQVPPLESLPEAIVYKGVSPRCERCGRVLSE